ncbi:MAG TPA: ABC transporter permease subunit, partial [Rudaea sp.]
MFAEIFGFELKQQLRSPLFWMITLAFAALAFSAAGSDSVQIGGGIGNVHRNAPYVVVQWLTIFTLLGMFLITVFVAGAALRDYDHGTAELFFATPIPRSAYLGGRFAAGYVAALVVLVFVALGLMTGVLMPWVDPERLGPTSIAAYAYAFTWFVVPNLFFIAALLFLLATLTRSMLGTYIGVIAFFVLWQIAVVTAGNLEHRTLGALIDPFGFGAFGLATRYWSAQDRNTLVPQITGILLANRAIWIGAGIALIAITFGLFRPDREGLHWRRRRKARRGAAAAVADTPSLRVGIPKAALETSAHARWRQFLHLAWFDTRGVLRGVALIVMLAFGLINLGGSLAFTNQLYGTKIYPVTYVMTQQMDGSYNWL